MLKRLNEALVACWLAGRQTGWLAGWLARSMVSDSIQIKIAKSAVILPTDLFEMMHVAFELSSIAGKLRLMVSR